VYHQFNVAKLYMLPPTVYLCVLCGAHTKEHLFPYTALHDGIFVTEIVFTAWYKLNL